MDDGFDVYGDLEDFDLGEKVKEVSCFLWPHLLFIFLFLYISRNSHVFVLLKDTADILCILFSFGNELLSFI